MSNQATPASLQNEASETTDATFVPSEAASLNLRSRIAADSAGENPSAVRRPEARGLLKCSDWR